MTKVISFEIDHTKIEAMSFRVIKKLENLTKFEIRLIKPNTECIKPKVMHTLEHVLATYMRDIVPEIFDISPFGCLTGFGIITYSRKEIDIEVIKYAFEYAIHKALELDEIPGATEKQCGSYKLHSLEQTKMFITNKLINT